MNLLSSAANILYNDNIILDIFHKIGYEINVFFSTDGATSVIYLILWVLMCLAMYFMAKKPKRIKTYVIKVVLIVLIIAVIFTFTLLIADNHDNDEWKPPFLFGIFDIVLGGLVGEYDSIGLAVMLVLFAAIYLAMKLVITRMFCTDKGSIRFRFSHGMPVCFCSEAFPPWQTVMIYLIPFVFIHALLYILNTRSGDNEYLFMILFMAFISSFDMPVVIYALRFSSKEKPDYISIDNHIHEATLFWK